MTTAAASARDVPAGPWTGSRRRVLVAMSGGVDSSVAAALLRQLGHDVIGVTLQLYDNGSATGRQGSCCAGQDIHDARRVAAMLDIPHYVLDYEDQFRRSVIQTFAESYAAGETPIPCVSCNQRIKFRDLLDTAAELGAEVMATGHYVRRLDGLDGPALCRAADVARDQSYFLFATTRSQLERLWFPLGGMQKDDVRALARQFGLPVSEKADSQDICFVPSGRYVDIVERLKPDAAAPGDIVHTDGRVLGRHAGIMNFTVGQRKGLGIASPSPLFVVRLDAEQRRVVVGPRSALATQSLALRELNWLGNDDWMSNKAMPVGVRLRSSQAPQLATLSADGPGCASVVLDSPEYGVATGQACVFYADLSSGARVLGGGIIDRTFAADADRADGDMNRFIRTTQIPAPELVAGQVQ